MKSSTRLDSAVFQLTPTRTRCDLLISATGKTEKIASGLLNPFLAHLKTAQDQVAKGGYSIILQPESGNDADWFTKGTVERFVRFVSTPEVLERVHTIESEILQIEEAIAIQSNNNLGLSAVEDHQAKPLDSIEGSRLVPDPNEEKAIVLYTPGAQPPEANGSSVQEGNSKVQLLKVLETRKAVLQKEQGMAFARAVAAGFDIDHMGPLMSFAESFGASRLMDACVRFMELWKRKHETGQWVEYEAVEAMSSRADFSSMNNASGIMLSNLVNRQKEFREAWPETTENNGKASTDMGTDEKPLMDQQHHGRQEYFQGQFPHPMFPPWPIHSPPGSLPAFQGYPMQGMPYYQNYPGTSPYFQQPYPPTEDRRFHTGQRMGQKRHSMDSRDSYTGSETCEIERTRSQDDVEFENETSQSRELRKKGGRSGKKKAGMVVIRNLNYITSKKENYSGSDSRSSSGSDTGAEDGDTHVKSPKMKPKNYTGSSRRKGGQSKSLDALNSSDLDATIHGKEAGGEQWQAFQNYLLRDNDEDERTTNQGMFAMEEVRVKRKPNTVGEDPLVFDGREMGQFKEGNMTDMHEINANLTRVPKASNDESLISRRAGHSADSRTFTDLQSTEVDGRRFRRAANDDFIISRQESQSGFAGSPSDPRTVNGFERSRNSLERRLSNNLNDDSYIVPFRSASVSEFGTDERKAIDMDSELPSSLQKAENRVGQVNYEPDDLSMLPERGTEKGSISYDPALEYEIQARFEDSVSVDKRNKELMNDNKQGSKKSEKDQKSKVTPNASDKKKAVGPIRKGKPSKMSPLDEARARAERLRTYKADLQKMKKEKEEAEIKRLEALKKERQKRIAARGSSIPAQSAVGTQQSRKQLPAKLSPVSHKASKFSDSEPGSSSPLQRSKIRTASLGSSDSQKASRTSKLNTGTNSTANRLSRSVSSLPETNKENNGVTPDTKASMARIRRLSEPRMINSPHVASSKASEPSSKPKPGAPESKKISAIMNHDRSKIASLPELKIKTSKSPDFATGKSGAEVMTQKVNGSKASTTEVGELNRNKDKVSPHNDGDDSLVIEKTVVMLECEKPSISTVQSSEGTMAVKKEENDIYKIKKKTEVVADYSPIRAPVSPLNMNGLDKEPMESQSQQKAHACEVETKSMNGTKRESPKLSSTIVSEKAYQAPFARISSLEDPCTKNSDYGRAPRTSLNIAATETETVIAHVSETKNLKLEKIPEALDKPQIKESKGFKRLLKFGRKNHSSATSERNVDSDNASVNDSEADEFITSTASSSEVHTLKNLISQDETPTAGTAPQKTSRHFSLLSPFRSKNSEKKLAT